MTVSLISFITSKCKIVYWCSLSTRCFPNVCISPCFYIKEIREIIVMTCFGYLLFTYSIIRSNRAYYKLIINNRYAYEFFFGFLFPVDLLELFSLLTLSLGPLPLNHHLLLNQSPIKLLVQHLQPLRGWWWTTHLLLLHLFVLVLQPRIITFGRVAINTLAQDLSGLLHVSQDFSYLGRAF